MAANVHSLTQATAAPATAEVYLMLSPFGATDDRRITVADLFGATTPITEVTIANTGLHLADTDASHDLIVKPGSDLTADRILTLTTGDAARTLTISADVTLNQNVDTTASPTFADLTLTGGDLICSTATTFNLLNATATTINAFGAATTIAIGAANAIVTLGSNATINGGAASGDDLYLQSTSHATKGFVSIQPNGGQIAFGTATAEATFVFKALTANQSGAMYLRNSNNTLVMQLGDNGNLSIAGDFGTTAIWGASAGSLGIGWISTSYVYMGSATAGVHVGASAAPTGKLNILGTLTVASGASAVLRDFWMEPATITISGSTNITTAAGFNFFEIGVPTYSNASIVLTVGATFYVAGPPTLSGGMTATDLYAVWVDAGITRLDGNGTHVLELPADATGNITVATGRVPIKIGAGTKYLRYFDD